MKITFNKIINNFEGLKTYDRTNPYNVAALTVHIITNYDLNNDNTFYEMLKYLMEDYQNISPIMKQNFKDRMFHNNKNKFFFKSYFIGVNTNNDYMPNIPYEIEINKNEYSKQNGECIRLLFKSGGTDNLKPITLRIDKNSVYYLLNNSTIELLTDIIQNQKILRCKYV